MKLVLDTNALWHGSLLQHLAELAAGVSEGRRSIGAVIPGIAWAERLRQVVQDEDRLSAVEGAIEDSGARIEPFGRPEAERLADRGPNGDAWREHARDFLIAAHVHGDRVGVTWDQGPAWARVDHVTPDQASDLVADILG